MKLTKYAFLMIGEGYKPAQLSTLDSGAFSTTIICVENIDMACEEAKKLIEQGIELIELCGAFKGEMIDDVINAVEGKIPVGNMGMREVERDKFMKFIRS
ncbi:DUF6506 family protein [Vibrio sp. SCSIO 43137]|uniref:DUF6506 family protein n=1 Tax=Vibrio sp. SCSIO 43137 TaxID=3021011 RepID=UPI00230790F0|nr:DUF6506 family protein [Vibrio sp. SCSIO 43137]WCE29324.1 DUF6506 family protein [Vibrio sp. SCSIO 43137]